LCTMNQAVAPGWPLRSRAPGHYSNKLRARPRISHKLLHNLIASLTIFPPGFNLALPGADSGAAWAVPFEVIHGVFIHNVITLILFLVSFVLICSGQVRIAFPGRVWKYTGLITALGTAGLISTIANGARFSTSADFGEAARLFVLGFYFLLIYY